MADAKKIGDDVMASLLKAVSISGPMSVSELGSINSARTNLQNSLRRYDGHASSLLRSAPTSQDRREDLDKIIRTKYPMSKGYTDKIYKRMVLRTLHRLNPFLERKQRGQQEIINASVESLTIFKLLANIMASTVNGLLQRADFQDSEDSDLQPEEFDPELSSTMEELGRELSPSPATDDHQKRTEVNVQRKMRRKNLTGKAGSEEEYRSMVAKYSQVVENARNAVKKHRDDIIDSLSASDRTTFSLISLTARTMNDMAKVFEVAASDSRANLVPGSYTTAQAFMASLSEITRTVIDSATDNRKSRDTDRKRNTALDKYLQTVQVSEKG